MIVAQRFDCSIGEGLYECNDGDWVSFEDFSKVTSRLQDAETLLREAIDGTDDYYDETYKLRDRIEGFLKS